MRTRIMFGVVVVGFIAALIGLAPPRSVLAQQPTGEGQGHPTASGDPRSPEDATAPEANDYLWIAGSSFKPRASTIDYRYESNGCITSLTGGVALNQSFTAPFRVPNGSVLRGVRFYYYDTSTQNSTLSITSYDGAGDFTDHVLVDSAGAAGAGNQYAALATPYTIDTAARGFVLNWYPTVAGPTMRLCGARVFYDRGAPTAQSPVAALIGAAPASDAIAPEAPNALDYYFLAGSSFSRRDSQTTYRYGTSGCTYTDGGNSRFTIDLNTPDGARVLGARFYYYDTSAADTISFYLTDYTGLGEVRDLLNGASSDGGFGSIYVAMGASYDPYTVNQATYSLNAIAVGADTPSAQLCGVRVFYDTPAAQADPAQAEEPVASGRQAAAADSSADALEITALPAKDFAHDLELPQGAVAQGLRIFYYNTQAPDGFVQTWNYTGSTADYLGSTTATDHSGYSSTYQSFASPYTVDHGTASLGVVPWLVASPTYRFCGVRVYYLQGGTSRYRFIAGSSFHPRTSGTHYTYEGGGCIAARPVNAFIPQLIK